LLLATHPRAVIAAADRDRALSRRELSQADETRLCAMIVSHQACLRSIDDTIFADFERADNVYCCA
ncbi:MAG TPA: hypothetical protein VEL04_01070, partial [Burkholderiales bacterium]|nr:hypothetical protein [Burkholderiales bacterium]